MLKGLVRQPRQAGKTAGAGNGMTFDGESIEIGGPLDLPAVCRRFQDPLLLPAHMFEKKDLDAPEAPPRELGSESPRRVTVMR